MQKKVLVISKDGAVGYELWQGRETEADECRNAHCASEQRQQRQDEPATEHRLVRSEVQRRNDY